MINKQDVVLLKRNYKFRTSEMNKQVSSGHPFVILSVKNNTMNVAIISSQVTQDVIDGKYPQDYVITDTAVCGLKKPSYVSCDCRGVVSASSISKVLGTMSLIDFQEVMKRIRKFPRRKILESGKIYNTGEPEYLDYFVDNGGNINYVEI